MQFKEIIKEKLIIAAESYSCLLNKKIFVYIKGINKQVVIQFFESNFLHLTGVRTLLKANEFYKKCFDGTITINDFNFNNNEIIKEYSFKKLSNLVNISSFFKNPILAQMPFLKGRIKSSLALTNGSYTIGFIKTKYLNCPQTLLDSNYLDKKRAIYHTSISIKYSK